MRRLLSILLAVGLVLGPMAAAVPASALASGWTGQVDETRLPACCRRGGAHHCAGSTAGGAAGVSATETCPFMPHLAVSMVAGSAAVPGLGSRLAADSRTVRLGLTRDVAAVDAAGDGGNRKRGPPALDNL